MRINVLLASSHIGPEASIWFENAGEVFGPGLKTGEVVGLKSSTDGGT